jgi:hypothetical protein
MHSSGIVDVVGDRVCASAISLRVNPDDPRADLLVLETTVRAPVSIHTLRSIHTMYM